MLRWHRSGSYLWKACLCILTCFIWCDTQIHKVSLIGGSVHIYAHGVSGTPLFPLTSQEHGRRSPSYQTPSGRDNVSEDLVGSALSYSAGTYEQSRTTPNSVVPLSPWTVGRKGLQHVWTRMSIKLKLTGFHIEQRTLGVLHPCAQQNNPCKKCCDVSQQWICLEGLYYLCITSAFLMFRQWFNDLFCHRIAFLPEFIVLNKIKLTQSTYFLSLVMLKGNIDLNIHLRRNGNTVGMNLNTIMWVWGRLCLYDHNTIHFLCVCTGVKCSLAIKPLDNTFEGEFLFLSIVFISLII